MKTIICDRCGAIDSMARICEGYLFKYLMKKKATPYHIHLCHECGLEFIDKMKKWFQEADQP